MSNTASLRILSSPAMLTLTVLIALLGLALSASAVSPSPELLEQLRADGRLQEVADRLNSARDRGVWTAQAALRDSKDPDNQALSFDPANPDTFRVIVLLADFSDNPADGGSIYGTTADFQHLLFSFDENDNHYSMAEFYRDNSHGGFILLGDVAGWYRLPQTYDYYVQGNTGFGSYPNNAQRMTEDAVLASDADVDYSLYDNDGNGWIDGLFIIHAGPGAEQTGSDYQIWSHQWSMVSTLNLDGVNIRDYSTEPEEYAGVGLITMGVFAHEYGHVLGLPDLYDTDYSSSGIGDWSLMAGGSWNYSGEYPAYFDAWCKKELGFTAVNNIDFNQTNVEIPSSAYNPIAFRVWENGVVGNEYFLVENRQSTALDKGIPGSGLLIMHIDESVGGNSDENHPLVAIEQADGLFQLEAKANSGDGWDVWSATTKTDFDDLSSPDTRKYSSVQTRAAVWNISASDSVMTANFDIDYSHARLELQSGNFSDAIFGNNNGIAEIGESIAFTFTVQNLWLDATNVTATMTSDNNDIIFDVPTVNIGTVFGAGGTGDNLYIPISFTVPADFIPCIDSFYLEVGSDNPFDTKLFGFELHIGTPNVLVIDDDNGAAWEEFVTGQLYKRRIPFDVYDKASEGSPADTTLNGYPIVIWLTGEDRVDVLSAADVTAMESFMDNGGFLFLTGQTIVKELNGDDPTFLSDYLRAQYDTDYLFPLMLGVDGSPIADGIKIRYGTTTNQTNPQVMTAVNGSVGAFTLPSGQLTGLTYDGAYKLVLMSFGFEAISNQFAASGYATQDTVFGRILDFFSLDTSSLNPTVTDVAVPDASEILRLTDHMPTFSWSTVDTTANAIQMYQVSVGTGNLCFNSDNMWSPDVYTGYDTMVAYAGATLEDGELYVFRARANNGDTWSDWSDLWFHMNAVGNPGFGAEPINDIWVNSSSPVLKVTNSVDPDEDVLTYSFEIYADAALTMLVASVDGVTQATPTTAWTVDVTLDEHQQYFWRSRIFDGYEYSAYTDVESFYVNGVNSPPAEFILLEPADTDTLVEATPMLVWESTTDEDPWDVFSYTVWVSDDPSFTTYDEYTDIQDTTFVLPFALDGGQEYYWQVLAADSGGASTWSGSTFSFYLESLSCCNLRGDIDRSGGLPIDIGDLVYLVDYMFTFGPAPECIEEADINSDGSELIDIGDLVYLVDFMFTFGPAPGPCF